jgi:large subunit ribosomal protein L10e
MERCKPEKENSPQFQVKIVPVKQRENELIFGAHADRFQDGMQNSFGKTIGTAARIEPNQALVTVNVTADGVDAAKEALRRGSAKLPIPCRIIIEKLPVEEVKTVDLS